MVVDYRGAIGKRYFAYSIATGSLDWASFLNNWLNLKVQNGFHDRMYSYWVVGNLPKERPPRWSVIRDQLHWVK